ncbi:two-component system response regulator [Psychrobium sp. 1_MG-2023]|uniref:response regulator n=1 Tax=Psychrobium sp. 1_MG-2023 TaxID=3062624 RepID=UPI000C32B01E|nr:two-component system response regulator [Psychrobium sp. 1_MG-2023]MDP2560442.1 two-component system response regulator [Psychrobium sp. 1_MG-2023]PKF57898.1 two-component system response regulator [Alteromonadales bacterium alter-6D02]
MMGTADKPTILLVDDQIDNIDILSGILQDHYQLKVALNGQDAIKICQNNPQPNLILLDINMPGMDGYEVCRYLKKHSDTAAIPIIFVTAETQIKMEQTGFELGAVDYIVKPISPPIVMARVATHIKLYDQSRHLESLVKERTDELIQSRLEIIRCLGKAAEYKDNETGMHVIRMSWFSRLLAQAHGMNEEWCELLFYAAPMHDIGKIGVPDHILNKPGKLTPQEWEVMQLHTVYGATILGDHGYALLELAKEVAIYHHEKWDGSGYPNGISGKDIPISARIVAIADVFDALMSERPYKHAWSEEETLKYLNTEAGKHFDPELIPTFLTCLPEVREVQKKYADE